MSNTLVRPGAPVRVQGSSDTPGGTGESGKRVLSSWGLSKGDQIKVLVTLLDDVEALKAQASPRMMMVAAVGGVRRMPRAREKVWMGVQRALQVHAAATMDWGHENSVFPMCSMYRVCSQCVPCIQCVYSVFHVAHALGPSASVPLRRRCLFY